MSASTRGSRGGTQFGPYYLKWPLATGGMGKVYATVDTVRHGWRRRSARQTASILLRRTIGTNVETVPLRAAGARNPTARRPGKGR